MPLRNFMRRYAKDKTKEPHIRPVQQIELSEKHVKLRIILAVVFLIIAVVAIGFGVHSCLSAEKGWQEITVNSISDSVSGEFKFMYNVGGTGRNATTEKKALVNSYTSAAKGAYKNFDNYAPEGYLKKINGSSDGEQIEVSAELYAAFEKMLTYGGRMLYYTPYFEYYEQVFQSSSDNEAAEYDPDENESIKGLFEDLSVFINDENAIKLQLLGDNRVSLSVSDEYRSFAEEYCIENLIGFGWLKNAFAADYISNTMMKGGYSDGYLKSIDGYSEYMDGSGYGYDIFLYDRIENDIGPVIEVNIDRTQSSVLFFSNYLISSNGNGYMYENGRVVTPFTDEFGNQKNAVNTLFVYSKSGGCAEAALKAASIYISEDIDDEKLVKLKNDGIFAIYIKDGKIKYTEESLIVAEISGFYDLKYIK